MSGGTARGALRSDDAGSARGERPPRGPLPESLYEGSDFHHLGYWSAGTRTLTEACESLVDRLLAFLPEKRGAVLDVACGRGATTRRLLRHWPAAAVTGVDLSKERIDAARRRAPGARFVLSDAADLALGGATFDSVLCVEGAHDFDTREQWLYEAFRVLRPGGRLAFSDLLQESWVEEMYPARGGANYIARVADYGALLRQVGFREVVVEDATEACAVSYLRHVTRRLGEDLAAGRIGRADHNRMMAHLSMAIFVPRYYVIGWARRDRT